MDKNREKFKYKWWAALIGMAPVSLVSLLANVWAPHLFESENMLIATLIIAGLSGWLLMMYLCWIPDNRLKSLHNFTEEFHIKDKLYFFTFILIILAAWLGVGAFLICLPIWFDIDGWTWGGILQFLGLIWIFIGYSAIINFKKK